MNNAARKAIVHRARGREYVGECSLDESASVAGCGEDDVAIERLFTMSLPDGPSQESLTCNVHDDTR